MPDAILPAANSKSPAFQFYPRDFISDSNVMAMECAAVGAYIRLISVCWMEDGLPRDEKMLARIAGTNAREWKRIRESVLRCFYERDGRYYHKRLDLQRQKQTEFRGKKVSAGSPDDAENQA